MAKRGVRVGPEIYSFYGPTSKVLCNSVKEEWNVLLNRHSELFLFISISSGHCKISEDSKFLDMSTKISSFRAY